MPIIRTETARPDRKPSQSQVDQEILCERAVLLLLLLSSLVEENTSIAVFAILNSKQLSLRFCVIERALNLSFVKRYSDLLGDSLIDFTAVDTY